MDEKKTVLFLMNGFGSETAKSFEIYSKDVMPTFEQLINAYPFKLIFANGELIGVNKGEVSNFKTGYYNFSSFGHPSKKENVLNKKIISNEFKNNEILNQSIDVACENNSNLHVIFMLGDKVNKDRYEHLKQYLELAFSKNVKNIYIHLILGDSSTRGLKIGAKCLIDFRNRVLRYFPKLIVASIAGRSYLKNGKNNDIANYYRMMVSAVGEIWVDYEGTVNKKFEHGMTDDNMNSFLAIRQNLLHTGDSIFLFNYSNNIARQFLDIVMNPKKYFPTSNVPMNITVNSLFTVNNVPQVKMAFQDDMPETYFFDKIPETKKILIMATKERIPYISKTLNGFRTEFKSNVSVWPIEDRTKRFEIISQYLAAYINQDIYDLIIVDCELFDADVDQRTIDQLKHNLTDLDKCLNITYNRIIDKDYRLIATSLYGLRQRFKLTSTLELVDMSQKVPFLLVDKGIRRVDIVFKPEGTFIDVARLIAISFGNNMPNNLVLIESPEQKKSGNRKKKLILLIPIVALLILLIVYFYIMYF